MAEDEDQIWTLGGLDHDGHRWTAANARKLTEDEFVGLQRKSAFIEELSAQSAYRRLIDAGRHFDALLVRAQDELAADGHLSPLSAAALPLDLMAVTGAARQLERELVEKIDAAGLPQQVGRAFHEIHHRIRASTSYLVAHEIARRADTVTLVLGEDGVHFSGSSRSGARDITAGLIGMSFSLVGAFLDAFHQRFEDAAADLEREATKVTGGPPHLISYRVGASRPEKIQYKTLPLLEIAALRRFYVEARSAQRPEALVQAAVALADANLQTDLQVGNVDVAAGLVDGGATEGINELPTAKLELDLGVLGSRPLDYWGPVHYGIAHAGYDRELFAGAVQSVSIHDERAVIECEGAANLTEQASGGTLASGLTEAELVRSLLAVSGLPSDALPLPEIEPELSEEEFEVLLPIRGLSVKERFVLGDVEIVSIGDGGAALEGLELESEIAIRLRAAFADADSYGRALVTDATLPGAEEMGVSRLEEMVAWIVTRGRYGLARLPDGRPQAFARQQSLRAPQTGSVVLVRGISTGRQWLRMRQVEDIPIPQELTPDSTLLEPHLPPDLTAKERHAFLALRRAASEAIVESQLQALWEAIEFYTSGTKVPKLFNGSELERLRESIPEWLDAAQQTRFLNLVDKINEPPLLRRLAARLEEDGVPVTDQERELLFVRLRKARNRPTHGKVPDPLSRAEINQGISIVARMLVYRVAGRG